MKCANEDGSFREDLGALLDGELDAARREEVKAHLETCEACREEFARLERLSGLLKAMPAEHAPGGLASSIMSAARKEPGERGRAPRPRVLRLRRWLGALSAAAAVLLVGIIGFVGLRDEEKAHRARFAPGEAMRAPGIPMDAPARELETCEATDAVAATPEPPPDPASAPADDALAFDKLLDGALAMKSARAPGEVVAPSAPLPAAAGDPTSIALNGNARTRAPEARPGAPAAPAPTAALVPARKMDAGIGSPGATRRGAGRAGALAEAVPREAAPRAETPRADEKKRAYRKGEATAARASAEHALARRERERRDLAEGFVGERRQFGRNDLAGGGGAGQAADARGLREADALAETPEEERVAQPGADGRGEAFEGQRELAAKLEAILEKDADAGVAQRAPANGAERGPRAGSVKPERPLVRVRIGGGDLKTQRSWVHEAAERVGGEVVTTAAWLGDTLGKEQKAKGDRTLFRGPDVFRMGSSLMVRIPLARASEFLALVQRPPELRDYEEATPVAGAGRAGGKAASAGPAKPERAREGAGPGAGAADGEQTAIASGALTGGQERWAVIEVLIPPTAAVRAAVAIKESPAKILDAEAAKAAAEAEAPAEETPPHGTR